MSALENLQNFAREVADETNALHAAAVAANDRADDALLAAELASDKEAKASTERDVAIARAVKAEADAAARWSAVSRPIARPDFYWALVNRTDDPDFGKPGPAGTKRIRVTGREMGVESGQPDEAKVRDLARRTKAAGYDALMPDVETLTGDAQAECLLKIVGWCHAEVPDLKVGCYGTPATGLYPPLQALVAALSEEHNWYRGKRAEFVKAHFAAKRAMTSPVWDKYFEVCDFTVPVCYTHLADRGPILLDEAGNPQQVGKPPVAGSRRAYELEGGRVAWFLHAAALVDLARQLAPDKPVVMLLWPRLHATKAYLSGQVWRVQLELARLLCDRTGDGVCAWDSRRDMEGQFGIDTTQQWYQQTISFLAALQAEPGW